MEEDGRSRMNSYNRLVAILVAFGSFTYGYCSAIIGSTIGQPGWYSFFALPTAGKPGYATTTTHAIATANGLYSAGGAIGSLFITWSAQAYGRKLNIQLGAFLALLGGAFQGGAAALAMFQVGRVISGLGIGILVTVCPMYLSEMSSPNVRGWLVGHHAIFLVFGYTFAGWLGYACYFATDVNESFAWRFPLAFQCLSPLILLVGSPWMPRSPRWLLSKGHADEAWTVLQKLRASPNDPNNIIALEEFHQIHEQLHLEATKLAATGHNVWTATLFKKSYRKRMIVGFLTQWGAEFAGPLVINNYSVILYTGLGVSGSVPLLLAAVWLTTAGLFYNPGGSWLHDKINSRRKMFMFGIFGCLFTTSGLAGCSAAYGGTDNKVGNGFGIFFIFLYLAFQGTFCDTTMYLYVSEIFPMEIRPIGMGFSLFGQFAATIILLQTAPIGFVTISWRYYLIIICWCVVFLPIIYFFFPETARLSLEEISAAFGDEVAINMTTLTEKQRADLDLQLQKTDIVHLEETGIKIKSDDMEAAGGITKME